MGGAGDGPAILQKKRVQLYLVGSILGLESRTLAEANFSLPMRIEGC